MYKFIIIGCLMAVPCLIIVINELFFSIKHREYNVVRVSKILFAVSFVAVLISIFAFISNLYDYITSDGNQLWFIIMMGIVYIGMTIILFIEHREKIIYSEKTDFIILMKGFHQTYLKINQITRFNLSDEFIDFYVNDLRFRYGNNFLINTFELNSFISKN